MYSVDWVLGVPVWVCYDIIFFDSLIDTIVISLLGTGIKREWIHTNRMIVYAVQVLRP